MILETDRMIWVLMLKNAQHVTHNDVDLLTYLFKSFYLFIYELFL